MIIGFDINNIHMTQIKYKYTLFIHLKSNKGIWSLICLVQNRNRQWKRRNLPPTWTATPSREAANGIPGNRQQRVHTQTEEWMRWPSTRFTFTLQNQLCFVLLINKTRSQLEAVRRRNVGTSTTKTIVKHNLTFC